MVVTHLFCYYIGCKNKTRGWYVDIAPEVFEENHGCCKNNEKVCRIWTRKFETGKRDNKDYALVMAHGMGAGGALFALSMDELTRYSTVYCIDLPGNQTNIFLNATIKIIGYN